ncbi:MAG: response regulator [Anaerolineaceae bacterium]|jgi:two-component system cell cycle response regulator DivK|nr:response regulator [Anaerolineaceae bacterium]
MPPQKTILHIEDNFENRVLVRRLLQSADYQVLEAENALQAINHLRRVRPDLILMDINMPDVDGYTLTAKLKTIPGIKQIPIVAITANAMRGDREKTLRAGCDGYIEKPIDIDTFLDKVAYFLRPTTSRGEFNG